VNQELKNFPEELKDTATSLRIELGVPVSRVELLRHLLELFETDYSHFREKGITPDLLGELRLFSCTIGRRIRVTPISSPSFLEGEALDIDHEARLLLRLDDGRILEILAGEVKILR